MSDVENGYLFAKVAYILTSLQVYILTSLQACSYIFLLAINFIYPVLS